MANGFSNDGGGTPPPGGGGPPTADANGPSPTSVPFGQSPAFQPPPGAAWNTPAQGGAPAPSPGGFGAPPAGFGAPPAGFGAQPSGFGAPPAGFGAQPSGFGAPPAGFGAQPSGFGAPPAGFGVPPSSPNATGPTFGAPPTGVSPGFGAAPSPFVPGSPVYTPPAVGGGLPIGRIVMGCVPAVIAMMCVGGVAAFQFLGSPAALPSNGATSPGLPGIVTPPAQAALDPDDALGAKLDKYVMNCLNIFTERGLDSERRYLSWADREAGPTGRERNIYGVYTFPIEISRCTNAISEAAAMPPSEPALESAAAAYAQALTALAPILVEADTYYTRQSYRDDDMAGGRALHPRLLAAFEAFRNANRPFEEAFERVQDGLETRTLARIANVPAERPRYLTLASLRSAKAVNRLALASSIEGGKVVGVDAAALDVAVKTVQQDIDMLLAFARSNPQAMSGMSSFSSYERECNEYVAAALEFNRRVRDGTPFDDDDLRRIENNFFPESIDGSAFKLTDAYDELVQAYNSLF